MYRNPYSGGYSRRSNTTARPTSRYLGNGYSDDNATLSTGLYGYYTPHSSAIYYTPPPYSSASRSEPRSRYLAEDADVTRSIPPSDVIYGLYLCGAGAVTKENINRLGITLVINCTNEVPALNISGLKTTKILVEDTSTADLEHYFDQCANKIHVELKNGGKIVVHCVRGISRSATIVIAYLMKYKSMTLYEAYDYVRNKRPIINPNPGFFKQLMNFERRLYGKNSVKMTGEDDLYGKCDD